MVCYILEIARANRTNYMHYKCISRARLVIFFLTLSGASRTTGTSRTKRKCWPPSLLSLHIDIDLIIVWCYFKSWSLVDGFWLNSVSARRLFIHILGLTVWIKMETEQYEITGGFTVWYFKRMYFIWTQYNKYLQSRQGSFQVVPSNILQSMIQRVLPDSELKKKHCWAHFLLLTTHFVFFFLPLAGTSWCSRSISKCLMWLKRPYGKKPGVMFWVYCKRKRWIIWVI